MATRYINSVNLIYKDNHYWDMFTHKISWQRIISDQEAHEKVLILPRGKKKKVIIKAIQLFTPQVDKD